MVTPFTKLLVASASLLLLVACSRTGESPSEPHAPSAVAASRNAASAASTAVPPVEVSALPIDANEVASAVLSGQACSLDTIDGKYDATIALSKGKAVILRGWVEDNQQRPAGAFQILLIGPSDFRVAAETGNERSDVATALKNPALARAGFNVAADLRVLPAGRYEVRFLMLTGVRKYWCDTKKAIILK